MILIALRRFAVGLLTLPNLQINWGLVKNKNAHPPTHAIANAKNCIREIMPIFHALGFQ